MSSFITAAAIIISLMVGWVGVQALWRRIFAEQVSDEDVLADRRSCGDCGCGQVCVREPQHVEKA